MNIKNILFIVILFTLSLYGELRGSIVVNATSSKLEALDLVKVLNAKGLDAKMETISSQYLVLIDLPKDIDKSLIVINKIKEDYSQSFKILVESTNENFDDIDVFDLLNKNRVDKNIIIRYIEAIAPEDRLLWLSIFIFSSILLVIFIIWIIQSYKVNKEQKRLQKRQMIIEKTLTNTKRDNE